MLLPNGHTILNFQPDESVKRLVQDQNWPKLDQLATQWLSRDGKLHQLLARYCDFKHIEHILALRSAPDDDEGIWHDDGSRNMAFSLSLTLKHEEVKGGEISLRSKGQNNFTCIDCQAWGTLIIFNTGKDDYEHRVGAVHAGQRLVLAGWCS